MERCRAPRTGLDRFDVTLHVMLPRDVVDSLVHRHGQDVFGEVRHDGGRPHPCGEDARPVELAHEGLAVVCRGVPFVENVVMAVAVESKPGYEGYTVGVVRDVVYCPVESRGIVGLLVSVCGGIGVATHVVSMHVVTSARNDALSHEVRNRAAPAVSRNEHDVARRRQIEADTGAIRVQGHSIVVCAPHKVFVIGLKPAVVAVACYPVLHRIWNSGEGVAPLHGTHDERAQPIAHHYPFGSANRLLLVC